MEQYIQLTTLEISHLNYISNEKISANSLFYYKLEWTGTRMPYFTNGIEVNNFTNLRIRNFKGSASPINKTASAILLQNGTITDIDLQIGLRKENVKD